jgi:non-ribosomal peptide synthase protein (TIGR01720 family)
VGEREEVLCGLFCEVLGVSAVSVEDSFFDLGGDSVMSIQLVSRARRAGLVISARDVFQCKTVAGLAAVAGTVSGPVATDVGVGVVPLTPIVSWLAQRGGPVDGFAQSVLLAVPAGLGEDRLVTAVQTVVDHHDALRLGLTVTGEGWQLRVAEVGAVSARSCVSRVDAAGLTDAQLDVLVREQAQAARQRLAPASTVMVQVVWFDRGAATAGRLLVMVHHLAVDGVSWRVLVPDLARAWQATTTTGGGDGGGLDPVGTSWRRWAHWLTEQATTAARTAELPLWIRQVQPPAPLLPDAGLDPRLDTYATAGQLSLTLPASVTEPLITSVPAIFNAGVNDVLLAGLVLAVAQWRRDGGNDPTAPIVIDLEGHGRADHLADGMDLSRTVGWFTSMYPVRFEPGPLDRAQALAGGPAAGQLIKRVKDQLRHIPDNGLGYGMLRYLNPDTSTVLAGAPTSQLGFNYLGRWTDPDTNHWHALPTATGVGGAADPNLPLAHLIEVNALTHDGPTGPQLIAGWTWAHRTLPDHRAHDLAHQWFQALQALVHHAQHPNAGGLSPTDIPLVTMTQTEIDELERELSE